MTVISHLHAPATLTPAPLKRTLAAVALGFLLISVSYFVQFLGAFTIREGVCQLCHVRPSLQMYQYDSNWTGLRVILQGGHFYENLSRNAKFS